MLPRALIYIAICHSVAAVPIHFIVLPLPLVRIAAWDPADASALALTIFALLLLIERGEK